MNNKILTSMALLVFVLTAQTLHKDAQSMPSPLEQLGIYQPEAANPVFPPTKPVKALRRENSDESRKTGTAEAI